jgi:flagellar operon protein
MDSIQFRQNYSAMISPAYTQAEPGTARAQQKTGQTPAFADLLQEAARKKGASLTFSKHAIERLDARQIEVSPQLIEKMSAAVDRAGSKGVTEALLLNGDTAFIVNVPNRTVVTSMNGGEMRENIFTNIDGAVIL